MLIYTLWCATWIHCWKTLLLRRSFSATGAFYNGSDCCVSCRGCSFGWVSVIRNTHDSCKGSFMSSFATRVFLQTMEPWSSLICTRFSAGGFHVVSIVALLQPLLHVVQSVSPYFQYTPYRLSSDQRYVASDKAGGFHFDSRQLPPQPRRAITPALTCL
jgi:hypothetical protein